MGNSNNVQGREPKLMRGIRLKKRTAATPIIHFLYGVPLLNLNLAFLSDALSRRLSGRFTATTKPTRAPRSLIFVEYDSSIVIV